LGAARVWRPGCARLRLLAIDIGTGAGQAGSPPRNLPTAAKAATIQRPPMGRQNKGAQLNGFLNVNKPPGLTSFQVITRLRPLLGTRKLGHSGVLDKPATGVLPIGVNRATKLFSFFGDFRKVYFGSFLLGFSTSTDDIVGEIVAVGETKGLTEKDLRLALKQFVGEIQQRPPQFSTTKVDGQEFYRLALKGEEVPHRVKRVTVEDIEVVALAAGPEAAALLAEHPKLAPQPLTLTLPPLKLLIVRITCRGGFYVRSLARDLGEMVGTRGCVFSLVREQVGPFRVEDAHTLEEIAELAAQGRASEAIQPMEAIAEPERSVALDAPSIARLAQGMPVVVKARYLPEESRRQGAQLFVTGPEGGLVAVVEVAPALGDNLPLHPRRVLLQP